MAKISQKGSLMNPVILVPDAELLAESELEFDCNCACSLASLSVAHDFEKISGDAPIQTCESIHTFLLATDFSLILSPHSHTTLAVINGPAQRVLDFFDRGGTLDELTDALDLPQKVCQQAVESLWQAGFLTQPA